ncbi:MAG: hypothetical protein KKE30_01715 [Gammaproteobacteria bacterium]|nr:hypothetical protein [Gammaproteobacteria bacterium]
MKKDAKKHVKKIEKKREDVKQASTASDGSAEQKTRFVALRNIDKMKSLGYREVPNADYTALGIKSTAQLSEAENNQDLVLMVK